VAEDSSFSTDMSVQLFLELELAEHKINRSSKSSVKWIIHIHVCL